MSSIHSSESSNNMNNMNNNAFPHSKKSRSGFRRQRGSHRLRVESASSSPASSSQSKPIGSRLKKIFKRVSRRRGISSGSATRSVGAPESESLASSCISSSTSASAPLQLTTAPASQPLEQPKQPYHQQTQQSSPDSPPRRPRFSPRRNPSQSPKHHQQHNHNHQHHPKRRTFSELSEEIDENDLATPSLFQLVLLLIDPTTRKFELLQLDFDSITKARVHDILAQIPISAAASAIRRQKYEGVVLLTSTTPTTPVSAATIDEEHSSESGVGTTASTETTTAFHAENVRLMDFCNPQHKKVLVALPKGMSIPQCIALARPILSDSIVCKMLQKTGFTLSEWQSSHVKPPPRPNRRSTRSLFQQPPQPRTLTPTSRASALRSFRKNNNNNNNNNINNNIKRKSAKLVMPESDGLGWYRVIVVVAILTMVLHSIHKYISTPIEAGVPLAPGSWRSRCGLYSVKSPLPKQLWNNVNSHFSALTGFPIPLPSLLFSSSSSCIDSTLQVNFDGTVSIYGPDNKLDMLLIGGVCNKKNSKRDSNNNNNYHQCEEGLWVNERGFVYLGGKRVKSARMYRGDGTLSPWPFAEQPKMRVKEYRLYK